MASAAITERLTHIAPITLEEMDAIKLMNRIDRKFVITEANLADMLALAAPFYRVLVTESGKTNRYDTIYYDTPDRQMYTIHQNGKLDRKKVRVRTYVSSGETFLEIKHKNNHGRTKKKRIHVPSQAEAMAQGADFLFERSGYHAEELEQKVRTMFERITLANNDMTERLTIDMDLSFRNEATGLQSGLKDAVIVELKQDGRCSSRMLGILDSLGVKPFRVSKYCIGTVLTDPQAKSNRFKRKVRKIEKIINKHLQ